jgi:RNA polymerase sigma factor (TIGR02999 family)
VHEAWLRLTGASGAYADRGHFLAVAAKAMRSVLVDHSRARRAEKRGGDRERTSLDAAVLQFEGDSSGAPVDLLDLDHAIDALEAEDPALAQLVELRFFSGMSHPEIAAVQACSLSTVERGWRLARAFLLQRLQGAAGA